MNFDLILIRYGELSLKSTYVRKFFESLLVRNIKKALLTEDIPHDIITERGRIYLSTKEVQKSILVLSRIFGIVSFSPVEQTGSSLEEISSSAVQISKEILTKEKSFAIRSTRVGNHQYTSQEVAVHVGNLIVTTTHAKVDLTSPDVELFIEIRDKKSFLFTEKIPGVGGLPLGTQGRILAVVEKPSSLLAAWYLMRRGCYVTVVYTDESNRELISSFFKQWFADIDILGVDSSTKTFYHQLATIAAEKKCDALVTGYTLDDPSSPFQELLRFKIEMAIPVLHPLIAMTQEEIQHQCKTRGISI